MNHPLSELARDVSPASLSCLLLNLLSTLSGAPGAPPPPELAELTMSGAPGAPPAAAVKDLRLKVSTTFSVASLVGRLGGHGLVRTLNFARCDLCVSHGFSQCAVMIV